MVRVQLLAKDDNTYETSNKKEYRKCERYSNVKFGDKLTVDFLEEENSCERETFDKLLENEYILK